MELYNGQLQNVKFNKRTTRKRKRSEDDKTVRHYCEDIFTFDIEVTSGWIDHTGRVIPYRVGEDAEYWNELNHSKM